MNILRDDLYYADLTPVTGSEQGGMRPVLIVQNDMDNRFSPTAIVAAITNRQDKHPLLTHILVSPSHCGLKEHSTVLLEQIRAIGRVCLRECIDRLSEEDIEQVDYALRISIGPSQTENSETIGRVEPYVYPKFD